MGKALQDNANTRLADRLGQAVFDLLGEVPLTRELAVDEPGRRAEALIRTAARKAGLAAGALSLPPGPLGWITLIPELKTIWRIQAQLVADLAAVHGRVLPLSREQMLYCLFRHAAAQVARDIGMRVGERVLVQTLTGEVLRQLAARVGMKLSTRLVASGVARWMPVVGASAVGAYAWYDTRRVAETTLAMLGAERPTRPATRSNEVRAERVPRRRRWWRRGNAATATP